MGVLREIFKQAVIDEEHGIIADVLLDDIEPPAPTAEGDEGEEDDEDDDDGESEADPEAFAREMGWRDDGIDDGDLYSWRFSFDNSQPRDKDGKWVDKGGTHQTISELVDDFEKDPDPNNKRDTAFRKVSKAEAKAIYKKTGLDVRQYTHALHTDELIHIYSRHGIGREKLQNQLPVTSQDVKKIEDIIENYDDLSLDPKPGGTGLPVIVYKKRYNGEIWVVEEYRTGSKRLAVKAMRKYKA